jgi:hypothetical protein
MFIGQCVEAHPCHHRAAPIPLAWFQQGNAYERQIDTGCDDGYDVRERAHHDAGVCA